MDKTQKEKIVKKFFDRFGNVFDYTQEHEDFWLNELDLAIKETEERMVRDIEGMAKENIYEVVDFKDIINLIRNK